MYHKIHILLLLVFFSDLFSLSKTERCIKKIKSYFNRQWVEKIDYKELPTHCIQSLSIHNCCGPITIKTGWNKEYLCLKVIKYAKNKKHVDNITITINTDINHHLAINTEQMHSSCFVEYELIIPQFLTVNLKTEKGDIFISDIAGSINTVTKQGNITILNVRNDIHAESYNNGTIYIDNAIGNIEAISNGNITLKNACHNISAHTKKGKINAQYKDISATQKLSLSTSSGNIVLTLPFDTSAAINGNTHYGTVICEHFITVQPFTTQLNNLAWNKFKKEVHGVIATGSTQISLSSIYGDIKILTS